MKKTGSRVHRFLRRGWLAGLAATSLSLAAHAQSPTFTTRASTSTADRARSAKPVVNLAAVESWVNGTKKVQDEAADMAPGTSAYGNHAYSNGCDNGGILHNSYLFAAVNDWRGPLDGPSNNSFGFVGGFNSDVPVLKKHGIGFSWGVVYDYMNTDNTGAAAAELSLGQIAQIGCARDCGNEIGIQGAFSDETEDDFNALATNHTTPSIDQVSLFWHHVCCCSGLETRLYTGWAEDLGEWVFGAYASMPINDCWSLLCGFTYIMPSSTGGP
jgi:hypothetical protein